MLAAANRDPAGPSRPPDLRRPRRAGSEERLLRRRHPLLHRRAARPAGASGVADEWCSTDCRNSGRRGAGYRDTYHFHGLERLAVACEMARPVIRLITVLLASRSNTSQLPEARPQHEGVAGAHGRAVAAVLGEDRDAGQDVAELPLLILDAPFAGRRFPDARRRGRLGFLDVPGAEARARPR